MQTWACSFFAHNFMFLLCVKCWNKLFCVTNLHHNKLMCSFDCESVHMIKCTCFWWVSDLHWTKFLNVCDELPNGCSSHKDQILHTCDSIPKMCNAYILHFSKVFLWSVNVVWGFSWKLTLVSLNLF